MNAVMQSINSIGSIKAVIAGVIALILLVAFGILSLGISNPVYSPLYSNLSQEDNGAIVSELGAMGVKFEIGQGGSSILVQSSEILSTRMALAQKGLPSNGSIVGYEIFDKKSSMGTSSFVLNVNMLRALEGELGRTISSLSSIKSARVHVVMPKRDLFRKNSTAPSASVILGLSSLSRLPKEEIMSIKHIVSSAVPGLKLSKITIVDNKGMLLSRGGENDTDSADVEASTSEEFRSNYENRITKKLESMLEKIIGYDGVKVRVTADMSFDRITTQSEVFDPDGKVARSIQSNEESNKAGGASGGEVSAANNLPQQTAGGAGGASKSSAEKVNEVTNFEISKTISNKVSNVGEINKLSIAVLVDGSYITEQDPETDEEIKTYQPRTEEEIAQITQLVKSAIGYNQERGDKIEVINMRFDREAESLIQEEGAFDWLKQDIPNILKTVTIGLVTIFMIIFIVRPIINSTLSVSSLDLESNTNNAVSSMALGGGASASTAQPAAAAPAGVAPAAPIIANNNSVNNAIAIDSVQSMVDDSSSKKVSNIVDNNPEETLAVIRTWMASNA